MSLAAPPVQSTPPVRPPPPPAPEPVMLSKIRPTSTLDGVPLAERRASLKSGVSVVDLTSGAVVATIEFQTAVDEVFDVQVLVGQRFSEVLGFQKDTVQHTFVLPPAPNAS